MAQRSYAILATNDGSGTFTTTVKYDATLSGGTSLLGGGSNLLSTHTNTQVGAALELGKLVAENDRAANA